MGVWVCGLCATAKRGSAAVRHSRWWALDASAQESAERGACRRDEAGQGNGRRGEAQLGRSARGDAYELTVPLACATAVNAQRGPLKIPARTPFGVTTGALRAAQKDGGGILEVFTSP